MKDYVQEAAQWRAAISGKPVLNIASQVELVLTDYHTKGADTEARVYLLNELVKNSKFYLSYNSLGAPYFADFTLLGMQAEKQLLAIANAGKAWGSAR